MTNSDIWSHFTRLGKVSGYKQNRASCKYCNYELNEALGRCKQHLKKCNSVPVSIMQSIFGRTHPITSSSSPPLSSLSSSLSSSSSSSTITTISTNLQNHSISNFVDRISRTEQDELELLFAKSIFQCGLFLSLSELEPIKNLWQKARPAFKLPGRKKISTTLLDIVYEETKQEVDELIEKAEYYSLVSDGW
jgi:hypothetical protein